MHDAGLKKMFSPRLMIELLVRRHVPEFAARADFKSLKRLSIELIGRGFLKRYPDMLWAVDLRHEEGVLVLAIEFQGRPERDMALRTTIYNALVAQAIIEDDRKHGRPRQRLAVRSLVLHHGAGPWNAPTRSADLFLDSEPDTYRVVCRRPSGGPPPTPLDLPEMVLRLGPDWTPEVMRSELPELRRVIEECDDEDFDRFMARTLKEVLLSEGYTSRQLEEAMTMEAVKTAFQRGLDEMIQQGVRQGREEGQEKGRRQGREQGRRQGQEQGRRQGRAQGQARILRRLVTRRFGPETATELSRLLSGVPGPGLAIRAADAILECESGEEFLARVRG